MKQLPAIAFLIFLSSLAQLNAQVMPRYKDMAAMSDTAAVVEAMSNVLTEEVTVPQIDTGKSLLITAGCLTAIGVALYAGSWAMISDSSSIGSYFSIAGISCVGASIPLYIAGGIRKKKHNQHQ